MTRIASRRLAMLNLDLRAARAQRGAASQLAQGDFFDRVVLALLENEVGTQSRR